MTLRPPAVALQPSLAPLEMSVLASDGLVLKGILEYPHRPEGLAFPLAVLAHQYPSTRDSYAPLIDDLLVHGLAILAFDQRGHGASIRGPSGSVVIDTPVGFTMEAFGAAFIGSASRVGFNRIDDDIIRVASWGAVQNFVDPKRILLIGSSVGGTGALLASAKVPNLAGLITFGAAGELVWGPDGKQQARRALEQIKAPCLLTTSEKDPFNGAALVQAWSQGLSHVTTRQVPGDAHGMAIYYEVREDVLSFLRKVMG
jgi:pimeloyl-ACP methyl ester carboxylesterase